MRYTNINLRAIRSVLLFFGFSVLSFYTAACSNSDHEVTQTVMEGHWETACLPPETGSLALQPSASALSTNLYYNFFANHQTVRVLRTYSDANCQNLLGTLTHRGTYELEVLTTLSHYNIDMVFTSVTAEAATADQAQLWSNEGFCGSNLWQAETEQSVLGQASESCQSFAVSKIDYHDLVEVHPQSFLYFGQKLNNGAPRPTFLGEMSPDRTFNFLSL